MVFKIAADFAVMVHFLWILFIILGFPIFLYFNLSRWRVIHCIALIVTIIMQLTRTICPLTYIEGYLKSKYAPQVVYPGSFIAEKIESLMYVQDVTLETISYLTIIFFAVVLISFRLKPMKSTS